MLQIKNVKWTSSDETIAKVDADGEVTALKLGSAAIIATTEDGAKVATCTVTVSDIAAQRTVLVYIVADKTDWMKTIITRILLLRMWKK